MLRLAIQRRLERGAASRGFAQTLLARAWAANARVERTISSRKPVLCIGGATLGGSGRTPLAIACARFLARAGHRVALVGHAYGARPPREAMCVRMSDDARIAGDEAIECARSLDGVPVFVARKRQTAIDAACMVADVIVLDGVVQLAPVRATLSLLALDASSPWGSGDCPPLGNLRAPRGALLAASDATVSVAPKSRGAWVAGALVAFDELRLVRVGLATGIARPERARSMLRAHGITPHHEIHVADHTPLRIPAVPTVDLWLVTAKDAARGLTPETRYGVIDYHFDLPDHARELLVSRFSFRF